MVKHQRRSHQRGINGTVDFVEFDGSDTDSEGESPSTPKSGHSIWASAPMHSLAPGMHGATLGGHSMYHGVPYAISAAGHHNQPFGQHRSSLSNGTPQDFSGAPPPPTVIDHGQMPLSQLHRGGAAPPTGSFYVTEQNNPGVATMNTNVIPQSHYVPRNHVERPHLEIPFSAGALTASLQSSPNAFSPSDGRSPTGTDNFYTHQPPHSSFPMPGTSPVDPAHAHAMVVQQQMPMTKPEQQQPQQHDRQSPQQNSPQDHQQQQIPMIKAEQPPQHMSMTEPSPSPTPQPHQQQQQPQYQPAQTHGTDDEHQWYSAGYQPGPMPVSNMQVPLSGPYVGLGTGVYHDAWAVAKMGYGDTAVGALPSSRLAEL